MAGTGSTKLRDIEKSWLPLAIIDVAGKVKGSTRFQKLVFLACVEAHLGEFFHFERYNYGPYSSDLAQQISTFNALGLIEESLETLPEHYSVTHRHDYTLTEEGKRAVREIESLDEFMDRRSKLQGGISEYIDLSLTELLEYVYSMYLPEEDELEERHMFYESRVNRVRAYWEEKEDEFEPLSLLVLAAFEQIDGSLPKVKEFDIHLDRHVIMNAVCDLVRASEDLFRVLAKYSYEDLENGTDRIVQTVVSEFYDIFNFVEEYMSNRRLMTPLSELTLSDIATEEEREKIKIELRKIL